MKQILLMRHAKSGWDHPNLTDFERPLNQQGKEDAHRMGQYLWDIKYNPAVLISSPAQRAKRTAQLCAQAAKIDEEHIIWDKQLYHGSVSNYLTAIQSAVEDYERIMLVGHNPLMEHTVSLLCGAEFAIVRMPTAALVCVESTAEQWQDIRFGSCKIQWMMIPKMLK
jgi:phosphohistidine phosphatase